jgi:hypothetical protein
MYAKRPIKAQILALFAGLAIWSLLSQPHHKESLVSDRDGSPLIAE